MPMERSFRIYYSSNPNYHEFIQSPEDIGNRNILDIKVLGTVIPQLFLGRSQQPWVKVVPIVVLNEES